jgi:hypothetical protein
MSHNDEYQGKALDEIDEVDFTINEPMEQRMLLIGKAIVFALLDIAEAIRGDDETTQSVDKPKPTFTTADILTTFVKG